MPKPKQPSLGLNRHGIPVLSRKVVEVEGIKFAGFAGRRILWAPCTVRVSAAEEPERTRKFTN